MSVLVFTSKLTTNPAFSPFHQEVSTLLGKQRPKLEVCNKIQGQKKNSFGVKPKLVFHQGHLFPTSVLYLKTLMPIFFLPYSRNSTVHIQTVTEATKMSQQLSKAKQGSVVSPGTGEIWWVRLEEWAPGAAPGTAGPSRPPRSQLSGSLQLRLSNCSSVKWARKKDCWEFGKLKQASSNTLRKLTGCHNTKYLLKIVSAFKCSLCI